MRFAVNRFEIFKTDFGRNAFHFAVLACFVLLAIFAMEQSTTEIVLGQIPDPQYGTIAKARMRVADGAESSVKPGDDFYRYANEEWLKKNSIPVGRSRYDNRTFMADRTNEQVQDLIQNAAYAHV